MCVVHVHNKYRDATTLVHIHTTPFQFDKHMCHLSTCSFLCTWKCVYRAHRTIYLSMLINTYQPPSPSLPYECHIVLLLSAVKWDLFFVRSWRTEVKAVLEAAILPDNQGFLKSILGVVCRDIETELCKFLQQFQGMWEDLTSLFFLLLPGLGFWICICIACLEFPSVSMKFPRIFPLFSVFLETYLLKFCK